MNRPIRSNLGDEVFGVTRSQHRPGRPAGRIGLGQVAITLSGSGGVGKSTFSLALASRAAERGQRVVLVDGNLGQGDLATFLRATGSGLPTMFDALVDGRNLEAGIITPGRLTRGTSRRSAQARVRVPAGTVRGGDPHRHRHPRRPV